jgi:hypothetical protein
VADEVGSDAIPDAAGGEGGHGAAKPDAVIHRNIFCQRKSSCSSTCPTLSFRVSLNACMESKNT